MNPYIPIILLGVSLLMTIQEVNAIKSDIQSYNNRLAAYCTQASVNETLCYGVSNVKTEQNND